MGLSKGEPDQSRTQNFANYAEALALGWGTSTGPIHTVSEQMSDVLQLGSVMLSVEMVSRNDCGQKYSSYSMSEIKELVVCCSHEARCRRVPR